jgi:hypothetical protein
MVLGGIVVAVLVIWAIMRRPAVQRRLEVASQEVRERIATWRAQDLRPDEGSVHVDATEAVGGGIGATQDEPKTTAAITDGVPAFEERQTPG